MQPDNLISRSPILDGGEPHHPATLKVAADLSTAICREGIADARQPTDDLAWPSWEELHPHGSRG
jgi:hypothetical protein